jgi:hypothetical protein
LTRDLRNEGEVVPRPVVDPCLELQLSEVSGKVETEIGVDEAPLRVDWG